MKFLVRIKHLKETEEKLTHMRDKNTKTTKI